MLLIKKCQFFSLFTIDKKRLEILLGDFAEKKETSLYYKKTEFFKVQKIAFFSKRFNPGLRSKNAKFFFI